MISRSGGPDGWKEMIKTVLRRLQGVKEKPVRSVNKVVKSKAQVSKSPSSGLPQYCIKTSFTCS